MILKFKYYSKFSFAAALFLISSITIADDSIFRDTVTQVSTINSLLVGNYDGDIPFSILKNRGDIGVGTVDTLDGELIAFDGKFYKVTIDGKVHELTDNDKTPFAQITFFDCDEQFDAKDMTFEMMTDVITKKLNPNFFYAVRVEGAFETVKVRSVKGIKPYKPLIDVVNAQKVYECGETKGVVIGIYAPAFMKDVTIPGFHLHFLSEDKKFGGHILGLKIKNAVIKLDKTQDFYMLLPNNFVPGGAKEGELEKVEKDHDNKK